MGRHGRWRRDGRFRNCLFCRQKFRRYERLRRFGFYRSGLCPFFARAVNLRARHAFFIPLLQRDLVKGNNRGDRVVSHGTAPVGCNGFARGQGAAMPERRHLRLWAMLRLGTTRNTRGFIFAAASMARFRGFHGSKKRWKTRIGTGAVWLSVRRKDRTQASTDAARKASGRTTP